MNFEIIFVSLLSGLTASLGLGGGTVFLIYLSSKNFEQMKAQGMNLLFFIPCAIVSIVLNSRAKLINWKIAIPMALGGFCGVYIGSSIAGVISSFLLRKTFAVFLLITGIFQLISVKKNNKIKKSNELD